MFLLHEVILAIAALPRSVVAATLACSLHCAALFFCLKLYVYAGTVPMRMMKSTTRRNRGASACLSPGATPHATSCLTLV